MSGYVLSDQSAPINQLKTAARKKISAVWLFRAARSVLKNRLERKDRIEQNVARF